MPSPTRYPRTAPRRRPLHERSDSHTNERTSPTLRIIGDPDAQIYSSSPFPRLPSQILPPQKSRNSSHTLVYDDGGPGSEDHGANYANEPELFVTATSTPVKSTGVVWVEDYNGASPEFPAAESTHLLPPFIPASTSSSRQYQAPVRPVGGAGAGLEAMAEPEAAREPSVAEKNWYIDHQRLSDEIVQLPSVSSRSESLQAHNTLQTFSRSHIPQPMPSKSSDTSLSSDGSTGTVIRTQPPARPPRGSYISAISAEDRPPSSSSNYSNSARTPSNYSNFAQADEDDSPISSRPPKSPMLPPTSSLDLHSAKAITKTDHAKAAIQDAADLQYPILHPPTITGSWAESISSTVTRPPRAANSDRWNPHLSTVHSEETDESRNGTMTGSARYSLPMNASNDPDLPAPLRLTRRSRDSGSTIRIVNERDDNLTALPPIPGSRDSAFMNSRTSTRSNRSRRNNLETRPSTRGSFLRDSIPAWARIYYSRHGAFTDNASRPPTSASISTEDHFTGLSRPRNRPPHQRNNHSRNRNSFTITPVIEDNDVIIAEVRGEHRPKTSQVWSPHLFHDRRCLGKRRSVFKAPSIDHEAEGNGFSRRNAQIFLFVFGFIFPFAWFIASFLPLPPRPVSNSKAPLRRLSRLELARDLEKALGHVDGARYENARWWRNLNRGMSLLGILILAAVITLAAVAVQTKK